MKPSSPPPSRSANNTAPRFCKRARRRPLAPQTTTTTYRGQEVTVVRGLLPLGSPVRLTTPFFNIYGLLTLVGGAIWSAYLFWRKRVLPNRVIGNVLIAAGALLIGSASTLTRLGYGQFLYLGELLSAIIMFAGFRVAARPQPRRSTAGPASCRRLAARHTGFRRAALAAARFAFKRTLTRQSRRTAVNACKMEYRSPTP